MRGNTTEVTSLGCIRCKEGKYRPNGHPNSLQCQICPAGFRNPWKQRGQCLACEAGKFQTKNESVVCNACQVNTFTDVSASTFCLTCPAGWYTPTQSASIICSRCVVGRYRTDQFLPTFTNCSNCKPGRFRRGDDIQPVSHLLTCEHAPAGYYQPVAASGFSILCPPGKYQQRNESTACIDCPIGWYRMESMEDTTKCVLCNKGETSRTPGSASCGVCALGEYGGVTSNTTKTSYGGTFIGYGTYHELARVALVESKSDNQTVRERQGFCFDCPAGFYNDAKSSLECRRCPADTFGIKTRATAKGDCTPCVDEHALATTTSGRTGVWNPTTGCLCMGARPASADPQEHAGYYTTTDLVGELSKMLLLIVISAFNVLQVLTVSLMECS